MRRPRPARLIAAIAAAALSSALAAPVAQGQQNYPIPTDRSGVYGGGAIREFVHFVSLRVRSGAKLTARATLVTKCAPRFGDNLTESIVLRNAQLDADGHYSATSYSTYRVGQGVPMTGGLVAESTIRFSARVLDGGLADGRARVQTEYFKPSGGRAVSACDTGSIPWTARRPAPGTGDGIATLQPGTHRGTTADNEPFLMGVTRQGRLVRRAGLIVRVDCPSVVGMPLDVVAQQARVRSGAFRKAGGFEWPYTYRNGTRVVERYRWVLDGRFGSSGARGTFELKGVVRRRSDGRRLTACSTGEIDWRASR